MTTITKMVGLLAIFLTIIACSNPKVSTQTFYGSGTNVNDDSMETYNCSRTSGTYTAAITYSRKAKINSTDTCEIEVEDCKVVRIYFLKHRLDETNMKPSVIDNGGDALVVDQKGIRYKVHILSTPKEDTYGNRSRSKSHNSSGYGNSGASHLCGYPTRKGTPCQRRVTTGHYCWQHGG